MYRITEGNPHGLEDVTHFIDIINTLSRHEMPEARTLFDQEGDIVVTRAPGRLDVIGGIADYSGSLVLQLPIQEATLAAIQLSTDRMLRIVSLDASDHTQSKCFEMPLDDFEKTGIPIDYASAQRYFQKNAATVWAAYAAGAFLVLMKERNVRFKTGTRILIHSDVPQGKGVGSSAALEVAVMAAVASAAKIELLPEELATLCQRIENRVVGAPCGIMDQMTSVCGKTNRLLSLLCQPAILQEPVRIPESIHFWGIDSGVTHSVAGADYTSVRVGAFMGYRMISELAGFEVTPDERTQWVRIADPLWNGYLANVPPTIYEHDYAPHLPDEIKGCDFIARYHGTTDEVTKINPDVVYRVARPTAHPIYEHFRVRTFAELLKNSNNPRVLQQLGELMHESHNSYSSCGLGSKGTDRLVELAREVGPEKGVYGAKITGGGNGGTVAVLTDADARHVIDELCQRYAERTNYEPHIFSGSSMGADAFGHLVLSSKK